MNRSGSKPPKVLETTVTFLEMTRRPSHRPQKPVNVNAVLLAARDMPLGFYRYLYFNVGIHWNWEKRLRLSDDALSSAIHAPTTQITVLYLDGSPAGYYEVDRSDPQSHDLSYFGLMPHAFGRGLGKWFLGAAIDACWDGDPQRITVNTCTLDHPAALPLYQKLGFSPVRREPALIKPLGEAELAALASKHGIGPAQG